MSVRPRLVGALLGSLIGFGVAGAGFAGAQTTPTTAAPPTSTPTTAAPGATTPGTGHCDHDRAGPQTAPAAPATGSNTRVNL